MRSCDPQSDDNNAEAEPKPDAQALHEEQEPAERKRGRPAGAKIKKKAAGKKRATPKKGTKGKIIAQFDIWYAGWSLYLQ